MKNRSIVLAVLTTLFFTGWFLIRSATAITLIPPSFEFGAKPGETIPTKVKVFNETTQAVTLYSSTANFKAKDETGVPDFLTVVEDDTLATWISLAPGPFVLQPGERLEVPVEIVVPKNAGAGGHFAGIFFSPQAPQPTGQTSEVVIGSKIAALVLLRVEGEIREAGAIAEFATTSGETTFNRLPIDFLLRFQNSGNVHVRPTGNITIRNLLGGTSTVLPINSTQGAVLPASTRKFEATWEKMTGSPARGSFFKEFAYEWSNFAFGPYTANVALTYGQANDKSATATVRFWVLPWRILILSILVIILIIWLIVRLVKHYNRWIIRKASQNQTQPKK